MYRHQQEINGVVYVLDIIDTAGEDGYDTLKDQYYRDGEGFLLVYSITSPETLEYVENIQRCIARIKDTTARIPIVLLGNKCDLESDRAVTVTQGQLAANKFNAAFLECSALTGHNINEAFHVLAQLVVDNRRPDKQPKQHCILL